MLLTKLTRSLLVLLMAGVLCCQAQVLQTRVPAAPQAYVLGPGDLLAVEIGDTDQTGKQPVRVDPGGFVDLPLAGRVQAGGLTVEQFKASLSAKLSRYITHPEIAVNLVEGSSQPVSVVGEVNSPGVHQLTGPRHLLEEISLSGGLKADAGPKVIITRDPRWGVIPGASVERDANGYSTRTISVDALMSSAHPEDNILMEPDDVVSIPRAELVFVLGDVKKAGGFPLSTHPTISLLAALSLAEGIGPDDSAKNSRILRRAPEGDGKVNEIPVNIPKIIAGKDPDVSLLANDVLYVPHSGVKVTARRATEAAIGITSGLLIYR